MQFGYSYPDMAAVSNLETRLDNTDRFVEVLRPPAQPQPDPDPAYNQSHYSGAAMTTTPHFPWTQPYQYNLPTIDYYQPLSLYRQPLDPPVWQDHSTTNDIGHTEPLGMPRDPVTQELEPNLSLAALVSQLERLSADVEQLVSRMDANERLLGDPYGQSPGDPHAARSLCRTAAPLPAAAAVLPLNLPPPVPPCSSDINGDEGELLDDDPPPLAVISQPGGPNTSPTLVPHVVLVVVPSLINMEISESVKCDCSSSSSGKRIAMEEFHNSDDISFNDRVNPNHGEDASFNSFCYSALDADARLIPPRTNQFGMPGMEDIERDPIILAREDAQSMNLTEAKVNLIATIAEFETPLDAADRHVDNLQPDPDPPYDLHEYDLTELALFSREDFVVNVQQKKFNYAFCLECH